MNKPQLGGIFSIVSGAIGALMGLGILIIPIFMTAAIYSEPFPESRFFVGFTWLIYSALSLYYVALGALAIVGGIFALKKIRWGWALAGAIAASMCFFYLGIVAVIMVSMSQAEFGKGVPVGGAGVKNQ
jgi:hypothetical protein